MKQLKVVSLWIVGIVLYLSMAGVAVGRFQDKNPEKDCSEFIWNDDINVPFGEARTLIDKYDACQVDNSNRGLAMFFVGVGWPIYLSVSYGVEFFESSE